jgi:rhodanese-related sulfurtransferase
MLQQGLGYGDVKLDVGGNLKDPELLRGWRNYHRKYADLVVVCASANMSKGAKRDATLSDFWGIKNQP